jgi:CHAD domain-containing protein
MTYRIQLTNKTVEENLQAVADSQIEKALAELDDAEMSVQDTVHQVRKRCKKLRGLVRLVRGSFSDYKLENQKLRDAAARLSYIRDAEAIIETHDHLIEFYDDEVDKMAFSSIREQLEARQETILAERDIDQKLAQFRAEMVEVYDQVHKWSLNEKSFEAIEGGLAKTYKRARKAMAAAREDPIPEKLHEWRKRVKYHWYQARLLREIWPLMMRAHVDAADELSDLLGDHHDLAVYRETLLSHPDAYGEAEEVEALIGLIVARQSVLVEEAFILGTRLLAEKPSALVKRWRAFWRAAMRQEASQENALAA